MANKNLSQLPTNATPQETDWLLGASGVSPAVFQKIPVGAIQSGGSGGSIKFSLPVNQNTALTSSGYYFTDNIAGNIGIDCSQLGIGDHISWVNLSTKAIVFYGLATVNGTTIPANKGVRIETNTSIEFFLKDGNFNARVLAGSHTLYWIPGQEPTGYKYWEISYNGNLSELQYDINGQKYTFSSANSCVLTELTSGYYIQPSLSALSDGVLSISNTQYIGSSANQFYSIRASFSTQQGATFNRIWLYPQANGASCYHVPGQIKLRRSLDGILWDQWVTMNVASTGNYVSSTTLAAHGFVQGALKSLDLPLPY